MKATIAVVSGFVLWSILWLTYNIALTKAGLKPADVTQPLNDSTALLLMLGGSVVLSIAAGSVAATIARRSGPVVVLGVLLLLAGTFVEAQYWRLLPLWYHAGFLLLLVPACLCGGWLRTRNVPRPVRA